MRVTELFDNKDQKSSIKCVVWDLDNTLWTGILLENDDVSLKNDTVNIVRNLDERGILQSIASKNDYTTAMKKLCQFDIENYFLYPQIRWSSKVTSITKIAQTLNIGLDSFAFVDDEQFERDEVNFSLPEVLCIDARDLDQLLDLPRMNPLFITEDSKMRRLMYLSDIERNKAEDEFQGPKEAFQASLDMVLTIFPTREEDLRRAEELTVRTNQLNATGYTYSHDDLNSFRQSSKYQLLMAKLDDKYGEYGHIGLALVKCEPDVWTIKLLLMSCRVMSRGVGSIMLSHIMNLAKKRNVRLLAEYLPNSLNRMMNITYRFSGFHEIDRIGNLIILENDMKSIPPFPEYVKVQINEPPF